MYENGNYLIRYDSIDSEHQYEDHHHNTHEIIFIEEGSAEFYISGRKYVAGENSLIFINNFETHKSKITKFPYKRYFMLLDQKYLHYAITDTVLLSIFKQRPSVFNHVIRLKEDLGNKIKQCFKDMHSEFLIPRKHSREMMVMLLKMTIIDIYREFPEYFPGYAAGENYEMISSIGKYIEENFTEDISLSDIAEKYSSNMYYLSHLFKEITGYGFKEFLIFQRLSKAKELLINTNMSVTSVCTSCGFKNVNHFIRTFKAQEGLSPLQYRKHLC